MSLSLPRLFGALHHPRVATRPAEAGDPSAPVPRHKPDDPTFLHAGFASLAPDLTGEVRQALGTQPNDDSGEVP